ncbi:hypothetical protein [Neptunomonas japonica]|uniref:Uncharacterized protein n=1 Tax=Neptunomonas japonica JAMM 1380 TaxID=1441457 RepID=A0A7R6SX43_9GAMM|nr:hypothetical protein [Neptunomonas japonica]BBB30302.1 conserved hypothetical protein [Neptunomonas japonica JAMM 1380]
MMIAELVDQDDFYQLLQSVGIPVESHWTPEQCAQVALKWRIDNNESNADTVAELDRIIGELKQKELLLLPEVKAALQILVQPVVIK